MRSTVYQEDLGPPEFGQMFTSRSKSELLHTYCTKIFAFHDTDSKLSVKRPLSHTHHSLWAGICTEHLKNRLTS